MNTENKSPIEITMHDIFMCNKIGLIPSKYMTKENIVWTINDLKKRKILNLFYKEFDKEYYTNNNYSRTHTMLSKSFIWSNSKKGFHFWAKISVDQQSEYRDYLNFNL